VKAKVKSREEIIQWFKDRSGVQDDDGDWVCEYDDGSIKSRVYCSDEMLSGSIIDVEPVSCGWYRYSCSDWNWHEDWIEILDVENEDKLEEEACKNEQKKGYYEAKFDEGKPYQLIPYQVVRELLNKETSNPWAKKFRNTMKEYYVSTSAAFDGVNEVLEYGLKKYGKKDSWKFVPDAQQRYCAAYLRHSVYLPLGHMDEESGIKSVYHALCNLMFLIWFEEMDD